MHTIEQLRENTSMNTFCRVHHNFRCEYLNKYDYINFVVFRSVVKSHVTMAESCIVSLVHYSI